MEKNEFTIKWKIENYFSCNQIHGQPLDSPTVLADSLCGSRWYLSFYPRGDIRDETKQYFSCFLERDYDDCTDAISLNFNIKILLHNGDIIATAELKRLFEKGSDFGKVELGKIEELVKSMKQSNTDRLIILCHMIQTGNTTKHASDCIVKTNIGTDRYAYVWKVSLLQLNNGIIRTFPGLKPLEITLICPSNHVIINIQSLDIETRNAVTCKIVLLDNCGNEHDFQYHVHVFEKGEIWHFPTFFSRSQLHKKSNKLLENYTYFTLVCYFTCSNGIDFQEIEKNANVSSRYQECCSTLLDDFRHMLKNRKYCDVQLRIGDDTFHAHKNVLSARSAVFYAMFEKDMVENKTGIVTVQDTDSYTFANFLEFLYNDSFENMEYETAKKLLMLGDRYQVLSLKNRCSLFLKSSMSVESVCDILRLSDMVSDVFLNDCAINFIAENSNKILPSKMWKDWIKENSSIANEVLCKISEKFGNL